MNKLFIIAIMLIGLVACGADDESTVSAEGLNKPMTAAIMPTDESVVENLQNAIESATDKMREIVSMVGEKSKQSGDASAEIKVAGGTQREGEKKKQAQQISDDAPQGMTKKMLNELIVQLESALESLEEAAGEAREAADALK